MEQVKTKNVDYIMNVVADLIKRNNDEVDDKESFLEWCEGGEIFDNDEELAEEDRKELYSLMLRLSPIVDKI